MLLHHLHSFIAGDITLGRLTPHEELVISMKMDHTLQGHGKVTNGLVPCSSQRILGYTWLFLQNVMISTVF